MKWQTVVASAALVLTGVTTGRAQEAQPAGKGSAEPAVKKQTVCPVMGGQVNPKLFVDYDGKRVYFCCNGCPAEFRKDPAKYVAKLEKDGVTLDKAPTAKAPGTVPAASQGTAAAEVRGGHRK